MNSFTIESTHTLTLFNFSVRKQRVRKDSV